MSNNRKAINYKTIGTGFALQVFFAIFIFKVPLGEKLFLNLGMFVQKILDFAKDGGAFVFGPLMESENFQKVFGLGAQVFALQLIGKYSLLLRNNAKSYTVFRQMDEQIHERQRCRGII